VILAVIALAFVGGYSYSKDQPETFSAQSRIVLSAAQPFDPLGTYSYNDPTRYVADQVALIDTDAILAPAAAALAAQVPPDPIDAVALGGQVTPEPSAVNSVIVVNATAPDARRAVARANSVALAYETYLAAQVRGIADAAVAATTDLGMTEEIRAKAAAFGDGVAFVETAVPEEARSSLAPTRNALLITAVAALVAIGLALLWRPAPPDGSAVIAAARTRVLGRIPARWSPRGAASEKLALTLVALDYARQQTPGPVLLTGTTARSGAASVAFGLAASAAARGHRVLLVDADPDRRELARGGSSAPRFSLEELGRAGVTRDEVLVPVRAQGKAEVLLAKAGLDGSQVIDDGAMGRALADLAPSFDLVLVQAGPVPTSPVAYALVEQVSAVVLVARVKDPVSSVVELRDRLEAARRPLIGLVLAGRSWGAPAVQGRSAPGGQGVAQREPAPTPPSGRVIEPEEAQPARPRDEPVSAPAP
jgi:Mrp family chromosome partitioning ATPase